MKPFRAITILFSLASLYIFTVQALPQWRPQGRFGKRQDTVYDLLTKMHSAQDDDNTNERTTGTRDLIQNLLDGFPSGLCIRLSGGKVRCLRHRRSSSTSWNKILGSKLSGM